MRDGMVSSVGHCDPGAESTAMGTFSGSCTGIWSTALGGARDDLRIARVTCSDESEIADDSDSP